jgi:probable F420-dependent oxidoreductase
MKIGLIGFNINAESGQQIVDIAQIAEAAGIESLWTFEHVMVPLEYQSRYPYTANGRMAVIPETVMVDPLIGLAGVAAATNRIRLGTGVNILPQTNPLLLAKQAASLDFLSDGRLMLGLGIGWLEEEYDALGVPFRERGKRNDDYLEAMRKVWSGDVVEHESEYLSWHGFKSHPLPVQKPLPIVIGGSKGKAFERIAKYAQGWYAPRGGEEDLESMMKRMRSTCEAHERDPSEIEVSTMWIPEPGNDALEKYAEIGVDRVIVPIYALAEKGVSTTDQVKRFCDEIMVKLSTE